MSTCLDETCRLFPCMEMNQVSWWYTECNLLCADYDADTVAVGALR